MAVQLGWQARGRVTDSWPESARRRSEICIEMRPGNIHCDSIFKARVELPMEKKKAPSTKRVPAPDEATILLKLIDGARQPLPAETEILVYVHGRDGENAVQPFTLHGSQSAKINVPFHDNLFDHYSVIASSSGYQQAGTFVDTKPEEPAEITLLLVKNNAKFTFPKWDALKQQRPAITEFLACDGDDANAKKQYDRIAVEHPAVLASLLNLATAMSLISLGGKTPLQYFRRILWDSTMAQDRF